MSVTTMLSVVPSAQDKGVPAYWSCVLSAQAPGPLASPAQCDRVVRSLISQPRRKIDEGVVRQPCNDDKVPVERVVAHVRETFAARVFREHQRCEHERVAEVGQ